MDDSGSVTNWISQAQAGDDDAVGKLWDRYFRRLAGLARRKLKKQFVRDADEEDAALSAMASFFKGLQTKGFEDLTSRDNLWRLLVVITARKTADYAEHGGRQKRGGGRVVGESVIPGNQTIDEIVSNGPTPAFEAESKERLDHLLGLLDDDLRDVAVLKLDGWKNKEIAERLQCPLRRVERQLQTIRLLWSEELPEPNTDWE